MRPDLFAFVLLFLVSCEERRGRVVHQSVYLYRTGEACTASARSGPDHWVTGRELRGVSATLAVGTELLVVGEELGKEVACWRVKGRGINGYVLMGQRIAVGPGE